MIGLIDNALNRITMYRLVLWVVLILWGVAVVFSIFGILPYQPLALVASALFINSICWMANEVFARVYKAQTNVESVYITAFILVLIITPPTLENYLPYISLAGWAAVWAMASKYMFAIGKKHLFNPAAFAVALTAIALHQSASWWIGNLWMAPFVAVGGLLIVRKIRRADLMLGFFAGAMVSIVGFGLARGANPVILLQGSLLRSSLLFFAFVMLTEPLTSPPTRLLRIAYGAFVGLLFAPQIHVGSLYSTPELALLIGNIFSYVVSPKAKLFLTLKERVELAPDVYDFVFKPDEKMNYRPGQYLEWTLGHHRPDNRGNRRYFTISSSPTEEEIRMGVKFYPDSSTFKKRLSSMEPGDGIIASQLAGDFVLPSDPERKLVFIAGGIGVTPFRSMIKYLLDQNEKRSIVILYCNKTVSDIAYKDLFDEAELKLGIKTVHVISEKPASKELKCRTGRLTGQAIIEEIPDYKERFFFISGPHSMVSAYQATLKEIGVRDSHIKTDFFPGFV